MRRVTGAVVAATAALVAVSSAAPRAFADEERAGTRPARPLRGGVELGGYGALTGPIERGLSMAVVVDPGHRFERYGLAVRAVVDHSFEGGAVLAGICFEPAASRPRLALSLHGEAGITVGDLGESRLPVFGGGVTTYLWPVTKARPFGLAFDGTGLLYYDGVDSRLAIGGAIRLILRN